MSNFLKTLLTEFNPARDMDAFTFHVGDHSTLKNILTDSKNNVVGFFAPFPKHILRGGLLGGLTGTFLSVASNYDVSAGFATCASLGSLVDLGQYEARACKKVLLTLFPTHK